MALTKTIKEREAMFEAFRTLRSVHNVVKVCGVHETTAKKYRKLDNWDKRLAEIEQKIKDKTDDKRAERQARHIKLGKILQKAGVDYYVDENGNVRPGSIEFAKNATEAIAKGIEIENRALGDVEEKETLRFEITYTKGRQAKPVISTEAESNDTAG